MAHKCPRCGGPVGRAYSSTAQYAGGIVGAMFYAAFGAFQCNKCGKIPRHEFPKEVRKKMDRDSILLVISAIPIAIGALWLLSTM